MISIINKHISVMVVLTSVLYSCSKSNDKPSVTTVEVPVVVTEHDVIKIPEVVIVDKSVGTNSVPKPIELADENVKQLGKAVAKVIAVNGSSGTGFFISKEGLFVTNEHVIPVGTCINKKCSGYKIVTGLGTDNVKEYTDFSVLAQNVGEYDFSILKLNLKSDESVDFLELGLDNIDLTAKEVDTDFIILGHPGGAALQFARARPIGYSNQNLEFKALIIPGNSGGPLVNKKTKKVYGLVKAMRTAPVMDGENSTFYQNTGRSTSISKLNEFIKQETSTELLKLDNTVDTKKLNISALNTVNPNEELLLSAARRNSDDPRATMALAEFTKLIGTKNETQGLSLLVGKSVYYDKLNIVSLERFLNLSVAIGRSLKWDESVLKNINEEIEHMTDVAGKMRLKIKLAYFNNEQRLELQKQCLETVPNFIEAAMLYPYNCMSTVKSDGISIIRLYADSLKKQDKMSADRAYSVMGFLMMIASIGISEPDDKLAITEINNHLRKSTNEIEIIMSNDSYSSGLTSGVLGAGAFKNTFN